MISRIVKYSKHLLLLTMVSFAANVGSQPDLNQYIQKINSDDGLSHNIANDIVQDGKGFIWIATHDGLNRFDGYEFKVYRFNPADSTSILGNYIKCLYVDQNDDLWISTRYGLNLYNPEQDNFTGFTLDQNENLDITKIAASNDGGLWISNYMGGFVHFDPGSKSFIKFNTENQALTTNFIMSIHEDSDDILWVGTGDNGVLIFRHINNRLDVVGELVDKLEKFDITQVEEIFEDINGNIWIASRQGVLFYHRSLNEFFHIQKTNETSGLSGNIILDIGQDYQGNIFIGTQEDGLNILSQDQLKANHPRTFKFSKILPGSEGFNLSHRSIQSIYEDKDRNIWLGTFGNGINLIPWVQPKFKLLKHTVQNAPDINFGKIWGICEDRDGLLWIGTDGMGLKRCNLITGEIKHYNSGNKPGDISDDAILCALCDSKGRLWFGTYAGGLNLYDRKTDSFIHFKVKDNQNNQTVNDIRCIFESQNQEIWIGTNGVGLMKLDSDHFTFQNIIPETGGLSAFDIRAIAQDNSGGLWLGTYGAGLFYYDPETGETKHFAFDRVNSGTLKCNIIYSLLYDKEKNHLWIGGSQNGGLNLLNLNNFTFSIFDHNNGLANNIIHAIEKDSKGRLWMSTNAGISLLDPSVNEFTNYDKLDGVQGQEFSNGSVLKSFIHNIICFGGTAGLNFFNADDIKKHIDETPILITDLKIFNEDVSLKSPKNSDSPLLNTILYTKSIELNHTQNNFTLGFSGFHYSNPDKIKYQYKLGPADQDWNNLQYQRSVTFQNLKAGEYQFKVRASNEDGIWSDIYESLFITIKPPPWKSWWAYVLYSLLSASFIIWIYYYNLKEAKIRHNLLLEKKLRAQEHDLYEEKIRFFTNISHELRTPLMLLINPLEEFITKESIHTRLGRTFNVMYRSANSLLQLINTLLEFRKTETGKLKLHAGMYNIVEQVEENCIAFMGMAARKNIELSFKTDDKVIEAWFDREKLEMILNNILSNAIKNTHENKCILVSVMKDQNSSTEYPEGHITILIKDEGKGIPEDELDKIFERFYQVKGVNNSGGTGIGLALTKKLVEIHKGSIQVESKINHGASFFVLLPLGNSHLTEEELISEPSDTQIIRTAHIDNGNSDSINLLLEKLSSLSPEMRKILVIEDNEEIRFYLNDLLKDYFIVEEAGDGISGLEKARQYHPALIICDIMMPELDGLELCKILKSELETSHIPILMITANLAHHIHINSLEVGADAFITKPFKPDLLLSRIYNLLKSREKLRDYYLNRFKSGMVSETQSLNKDEEFLIKVNGLIHKNLNNNDFSITLLHKTLGVSRTVFYNKIKSLTNYSPIDLIRHIRLKRASELLSTREYKVYEVMMKVGFNDEKHFRQLFKKQFGVMPSEYLQASLKK